MKALYPFQLKGVTKSPIWGGTRLCRDWNKTSDAATVGESWELTVRKNEVCQVVNGALAGSSLDALIHAYGDAITGGGFGAADFPLLIKLIDAGDRLSVQVHPDDTYAARVENDRGKTEMWYIVEAEPGAEIICGLSEGLNNADFAKAVANGSLEGALKHQPVKAGEAYFIPAGLPHAIGKGILIAEIQQNCDLTYRVYDYERRDANGNLRELHVQKALDVIRPFTPAEIDAVCYSRANGDYDRAHLLACCDFFRVEKLELDGGACRVAKQGVMRHLLCLGGEMALQCGGETYTVAKGDSWLLPAELNDVTLSGSGVVLISSI